MRPALLIACMIAAAAASSTAYAEEKGRIEQKPGQPLYFPADQYKQHPADLAPETDPQWQRYQGQQQQRIEQGKPAENPYEDTPTVIREETTRYEIMDDKKKRQPPKRWE